MSRRPDLPSGCGAATIDSVMEPRYRTFDAKHTGLGGQCVLPVNRTTRHDAVHRRA